ncbi:MAG: MarR family transcriptional regulator [Methanoregula sp.]|jgi:uncharacterized membrane protein|uniref:helix-turn-helix transcriptional regulator n=1 Tax=Methanoregula sp. TaxID=2052170 RepID=UPI003C77013C
MRRSPCAACILLLLILLPAATLAADTTQDYSIAYLIALHKDGSAVWNIEYRIPLHTPQDDAAFEQNANTSSILSEASIRDLMAQSAAEDANVTGRLMEIDNFVRVSSIQSMPTGTYGVIRYTFLWTNFTETGDEITMGDVFVGGLYLPVGASLIVQPPPGYAVTSAGPAPEIVNGNLVWYGPASFDAGEPSVTLAREGMPFSTLILVGVAVLVAGVIAFLIMRRKKEDEFPSPDDEQQLLGPKSPPAAAAGPELGDAEGRILVLITESGGECYQSDIVEKLGLPKSTVSAAINSLHMRGLVQKIKKGRENLIRRVPEE